MERVLLSLAEVEVGDRLRITNDPNSEDMTCWKIVEDEVFMLRAYVIVGEHGGVSVGQEKLTLNKRHEHMSRFILCHRPRLPNQEEIVVDGNEDMARHVCRELVHRGFYFSFDKRLGGYVFKVYCTVNEKLEVWRDANKRNDEEFSRRARA